MDDLKREFSAGVVVYYEEVINDVLTRLYLLLLYRKGYWDLAKGKLEQGETSIQAATRELKEETGLEAEVHPGFEQSLSYMFKDPQGFLVHKTVTYFVGKVSTKQIQLSSEHLNYKWLPIKEALTALTYSNTQQILSMADHYVDSFKYRHE